jgi:hypothetical protein
MPDVRRVRESRKVDIHATVVRPTTTSIASATVEQRVMANTATAQPARRAFMALMISICLRIPSDALLLALGAFHVEPQVAAASGWFCLAPRR